jgi:hypothetical protein
MLLEADLPDDVDALRPLVLEQAHELDLLKVFPAESERLQAIIDALMRHRFGRKSEQLDADQFELALEEVEAALSQAELAMNRASKAPCERPRKTNRESLPTHLERIEQVVDVERRPAPVAATRSTRTGTILPSASMSCLPPSAFWSPGARAMAIARARTLSCRLRHLPGSSKAASPPRR